MRTARHVNNIELVENISANCLDTRLSELNLCTGLSRVNRLLMKFRHRDSIPEKMLIRYNWLNPTVLAGLLNLRTHGDSSFESCTEGI